jgi:stress-induced morphogen
MALCPVCKCEYPANKSVSGYCSLQCRNSTKQKQINISPAEVSNQDLKAALTPVYTQLTAFESRLNTGDIGGVGDNAVVSVNGETGIVVLTKTDIGLSNVDNTSDVNKPISNDVQNALDDKAAVLHTHDISDIVGLQANLDSKQAAGSYAAATHSHLASEVLQNSTARFVTDAEKTAWNAKVTSVNGQTAIVTLTKSDIGLANVDNTSDANKPVSTATQTALDLKADLVGGVIPTNQIPAIAVSEFLGTTANQAAMLALSGQRGDWTIRTDENKTYFLIAEDATQLSNWKGLETPASAVVSVNGQIGVIVLGKTDVGLANVDNTSDANKPVSTATQTALDLKANLNSPAFTGTPTLPTGTIAVTQTAGDSTTKIATTAFVTAADNLKANLASPVFTGTPTAPTAAPGTNTTQLATTAFVIAADTLKANLASPTFTGVPAAPTATQGTNTTQLATTAFVITEVALKQNADADLTAIAALSPTDNDIIQRKTGAWTNRTMAQLKTDLALVKADVGLANVDNTSDADKPISIAAQTALNAKADIASPTFTGTPTLPTGTIAVTQTAGDSTTKVATTAFVTAADNLKANLASPTFTGVPAAPTATTGTNTTQLATTAFVQTEIATRQPLDSDLTAIAAIAPSNDDIIQRKAGAWINRTMAQLKTDLALTKSDVGLSNVDNTSDANKPISTATQSALNLKADLVGGVIPSSQLPALAISEFLGTVANEAAMLALSGQRGDWAIRTDESKTYIIIAEPSSLIGSWRAIDSPAAAVSSVNSQTGTVVLGKADVGLGNVDNTSDTTKWAASATLTNKTISGASNTLTNIAQSSVTNLTTDLAAKAPLASPSLTGTPTAPTATSGTNTTQIATTAFVQAAVAAGGITVDPTPTENSTNAVQSGGTFTALADKQPLDDDLTAIAALAPLDNDVLQRKTGAWVNRTMAQLKTDLALVKADVGLGNVDNTSDATKNSAVATLTNKTIDGGSNTLTNIAQSSVVNLTTDLAAKASLASPALTGTPTAPTATSGTNTTQIATTAYVLAAIASGGQTIDDTLIDGSTNAIQNNAVFDALALKANLASPALTGTPTAPTAANGTNTTQIATTAFVAAGFQPLDSDLTTFAGLSPADDTVLQRKSSAWTARTPAQLKTDLALTKTDVGLSNVDNTSDANKPVSTAQQTALNLKADLSKTVTAQGVNYTLVLADAGDVVRMNVASANTLTVPANATVAFPVGTEVMVHQMGAGKTTLTAAGGVTFNNGMGSLNLRAQYSTAKLTKVATDTWQVEGDLESTYQPFDTDLTTIAGLSTSSNDVIMQVKSNAWTVRTPAQVKTDLVLTKSDVGLANVDNTSDANKPVSTAQQTALDGKQPLDSDLTAIAALSASNNDVIQRKAGVWVNSTPATLKTDLALVKADVGLANVDNTSDANKPVSTAQQTALNLKANIASPTFTGTLTSAQHNIVVSSLGTTQAETGLNLENATAAAVGAQQISPALRFKGSGWKTNATAAAQDVEFRAYVLPVQGTANPTGDFVLQQSVNNGAYSDVFKVGTGGTLTLPTYTTAGFLKSTASTGVITTATAIAQSEVTNLTTDLSNKQPLDSDLTAIAALSPTDNDIIQRKASAWVNRTPAQFKTDLSLVKADVGLSNVDNTSDANKPVSVAQQSALDLKASLASPTFTGTPAAPTAAPGTNTTQVATTAFVNTAISNAAGGYQPLDNDLTSISALGPVNDDIIQRKLGVWTNRNMAQVKVDLALVKADVGLANVDNTSDANKPVSTAQQTALNGKQPLDTDLTAIAGLAPTNDDIIQRKAGAWTNRTIAQFKTDLNVQEPLVNQVNIKSINDISLVGAGNIVIASPSRNVLSSNAVNSNSVANTLQDITGLQFAVTSGSIYKFRFIIPYETNDSTTGSRWTINGPTATWVRYYTTYSIDATTPFIRFSGAYNLSASATTSTGAAGAPYGLVIIEGMVKPSASGNLTPRFASEVSNAAVTALAGAYCEYEEIA